MNTVASGLRADVVDRVACAGGAAEHEFVGSRDPEAEHIHERIGGVGLVERDLTSNGRDADAVAVAGDPGNDAFHDAARARTMWPIERAETK